MKTIFNFNRPYVRNPNRFFTPIYMPYERYSLYINFADTPPSSLDSFNLVIVTANSPWSLVATIAGGLSKLYVAGTTGYHLYNPNFVFPKIPDGQYYFSAVNATTGNEAYRSNLIIVDIQSLMTTSYVEVRHNDQLFGVRYDLLPNFWQKFRLPINQIKSPDISSIREQYRQSSGQRELRNSKSFRDIKQTLEMYWANDEDFQAMSAILEHSEVRINGTSLICLDQVKVEQPSDFSNQYKGTFTVIAKEDNNFGKYYVADFIASGGTNNYITSNFITP